MRALVLAGGAGTRLRPITHTSAKQLVPLANKPILFYGLEAIRDAGISEVGIIVGDTEAEIRGAVGDGSTLGLRVTYLRQEAPLGLAHAVLVARHYLADEPFVMYLGDNFLVGGITALVEEFAASTADAQILLAKVPDPGRFGVAELGPDGRVLRLEEKPPSPRSDLALVGVYLFRPRVHEAVRAISPSARGELEITDAISELVRGGADVRSRIVSGYWKDTGRVEDLLECNRAVLEVAERRVDGDVDAESEIVGRVVLERGARVERSTVRGPVAIGAGARVVDSYVGPFTSIGPGCIIEETEIEYSVVLAESSITGVRPLESSLIGRNVEVTPARGVRRAHRLTVGDHSRVQIAR